MLEITIPARELYDEDSNRFIYIKETTLRLEHSLVSLAKWESKWKKPFLNESDKTQEMFIDYVKCMTITQNVDQLVYQSLTVQNLKDIQAYIDDSMTATWFSKNMQNKKSNEIVTAELIYYWMIALQIPMECQKWHLNRLLTLVQVCNIKNQPAKKMKKGDILKRNSSINAARRQAMNSKG